mmetsp:Transcript_104337/g.156254  ORF Transcript_104337/g.156254 Transcript_104337/m.156254 type:complete len:473 (+) Transcript_104337:282-1700(+)
MVGVIGNLKHIIVYDAPETSSNSFAHHLKSGVARSPESVGETDVATLIYTSGTTGNPKGVELTNGNILSNVLGLEPIFPLRATDRSLSFLPWAHCFGQTAELHGMLRAGGAMAINTDVPSLTRNLNEVNPTLLFSVPQVFTKIHAGVLQAVAVSPIKAKLFHAALGSAKTVIQAERDGVSPGFIAQTKFDLLDKIVLSKIRDRFGGQLRLAICGGAALATEAAEFMEQLGVPIYEGYGLTETSPVAACGCPGARRPGTVGHAIPGVKVFAVDTDMSPVDRGQQGELVVQGPNVMQRYHNNPTATDEAIVNINGVRTFRTGDLGIVDTEGFVRITGRAKEQYKLENGKYVVPSHVEEQLKLSPFIHQVFLYGDNKPHNVALVVPAYEVLRPWAEAKGIVGDNTSLVADATVVEHLNRELSEQLSHVKGYESPKTWKFLDEEFNIDNGLCTPKMSLKRNKIVERFHDTLQSLYE